jgi:hypothetical protein
MFILNCVLNVNIFSVSVCTLYLCVQTCMTYLFFVTARQVLGNTAICHR